LSQRLEIFVKNSKKSIKISFEKLRFFVKNMLKKLCWKKLFIFENFLNLKKIKLGVLEHFLPHLFKPLSMA